jgi:hypothetical protein
MANPYSEAEKAEVARRYEAGESAAQIASALPGRNAFTVGGVIRSYRIKKGEIPDPLAGKRGFRHPKPEPSPDEEPRPKLRMVTHVEMPRTGPQKQPTDGIPLFVDGAARLEVHRKRSRPVNPVMQGFLGEVSGGTTLTELAAEFGGGEYRLVGWDAKGKPLGERHLAIAGDSVGAAEMGGALPPFYVPPQTDQRLFDMLDRDREQSEARRREDLQREERGAERERIRQEQESVRQREWLQSQQSMQTQQMAALMQMQQQASAAQMQVMTTLLTTAMGQGNNLTGLITAMGAMKDLIGSGDEDPTVSLLKAAPTLLDSLKDFGKMKVMGQAQQQAQLPEQAQQTDEQLGQTAAANMLTILMRKGLSQQDAEAEVMKVYGHLDKVVRTRQAPKQAPAPRRPPPAASPSNGSGASTPAGASAPNPAVRETTVQS